MEHHKKLKKTPHIKEENAMCSAVIVPQNTPLYEHVCKEREGGYNGDDKNPWKRPKRAACCTHYCTTKISQVSKPSQKKPQKRELQRNHTMPAPYRKPGQKPWTTDEAEPPTYDAIWQHLEFCTQARVQQYPLNPFLLRTQELAVLMHQKPYRPIKMSMANET
ncbi:hypothetical protein EDB92DRAFT_1821980 [Lactarius akahatsu]|uniref:Uncharacterized protein n=1 Tax=Lactarius akahatsu TaxID=416441 RepID=A0AAD4L9V5_9AGAM|nr:hypothetical protein EDB92DRAFT_1821980 [Lactarius akahatsu]